MPLEATTGASINVNADDKVQITIDGKLLTLDDDDQTGSS